MSRRRRMNPWDPWMKLGLDTFALGMEASAVIGLRTLRLAAGGAAAAAEAERMVSEKVRAAAETQILAATGARGFTPHGAAAKTVSRYRRKVRANRRRLAKG